jgi:hypothetical protein
MITIRKTPCPDVDLEINGVNEGSFAAGSTIELNLTDGVNPVTPDSVTVVGNVVTAQVPAASTGWVRNPDWLPLPEITAADNRFVGLFLVFENEYNQLTYIATGSPTIDFGDGTSDTVINSIKTKVYDYATITTPVYQYYDGRNYKQVIVDVSGTIGNSLYLDQNNGINNNGTTNFVDVSWSLQNVIGTQFRFAEQRKCRYLEQIKAVYQNPASVFPRLEQARMLESVIVSQQVQDNVFISTNAFIFSGLLNVGVIKTVAQSCNSLFSESLITEIHVIAEEATANAQSIFNNCRGLRKARVDFRDATNISNLFTGCLSLDDCEVNGLSNVTTAASIFNSFNLSRLILNGFRLGFTVANNRLTAQALNDLFTSLGTASGSQTIIVTGNPGAATCDTTIATAKGFTVTT